MKLGFWLGFTGMGPVPRWRSWTYKIWYRYVSNRYRWEHFLWVLVSHRLDFTIKLTDKNEFWRDWRDWNDCRNENTGSKTNTNEIFLDWSSARRGVATIIRSRSAITRCKRALRRVPTRSRKRSSYNEKVYDLRKDASTAILSHARVITRATSGFTGVLARGPLTQWKSGMNQAKRYLRRFFAKHTLSPNNSFKHTKPRYTKRVKLPQTSTKKELA